MLLGENIHQWKLSDGNVIGVNRVEIKDLMRGYSDYLEPILHIGSKSSILDKHGGKWRNLYQGKSFIGIDLESGENVDCVFDITDNISKLRKKIGIHQFSTIICPHVLEHVRNPFIVADNIRKLLRPKGYIVVSVPWVQGFHEFPDDYWRMSFSGLKELFKGLLVIDEYYSGASEEFAFKLIYNGKIEHSIRTCRLERNLFQIILEIIPEQDMFDEYEDKKIKLSKMYMPGMSVNMVLQKN